MQVVYQGRTYEASQIKAGEAIYYEIPGIGQVPASWVEVRVEPLEQPPAPEPEKTTRRRKSDAATDE